jgi:hypothetical protein
LFIKQVVCLSVSVAFILGISFPATAGNTALQMLTVSVQVLDKSSAHKAAVRSTPVISSVNTYTRVKETKIIADYSIDHSLTVEKGKNVTITGRVEEPLLDEGSLYIRSAVSRTMNPYNISLSTTEQDLIAAPTKDDEESISNTYPFHYSLSTAADNLEEIQLTKPIIVVLTVYY